MDNGREVVAKVPNPNASIPRFTTASEVATMDFARKILDTPAPFVHAWNSQAKSHPVGAEFIIMDKMKGVPLSQVWAKLQLPQKHQVLLAVTRMQKRWLSVSFSHYGSLYYASHLQTPAGSHYIKDGKAVVDSEFALDQLQGESGLMRAEQVWISIEAHVRSEPLPHSMTQLLTASRDFIETVLTGSRASRTNSFRLLKPPKQIALFCGPRLYQPNSETKLAALTHYQQIIDALCRVRVLSSYHTSGMMICMTIIFFVNPSNPEEITGIIDWQSCHISPLYNHNPDPAFFSWDGLEPKTLDLLPRPKLSGLSPEERAAALHEYSYHNIFIGWRKLMQAKNPELYAAVEFRKTAPYGFIFLAHRMFEYGEAHFESLLADLKDTWPDLPAVPSNKPFPFDFSKEEYERIKFSSDNVVAATDLVTEVKEQLGDLWPDKGFIEHDRFDECKFALKEVRLQILEQLAQSEEERAEFDRHWPFK
ncbi:hypothetical protein A7D00_4788 [Trichophyton violaceum]|uniref:Phosphotransferase enzyme family protein n=1 Tax=Trichophyton violaceum TaxID=34388 RepID=A0A178FGT5_TRIVO|nr:hypothetical protein A7D00_4788 [Trichophyton violaceum]